MKNFLQYVLKMMKSEKREERSQLKQMKKNLIESVKEENSQRRFLFLNVTEKRKVFRKGTEEMLTLKYRHQNSLSSSF